VLKELPVILELRDHSVPRVMVELRDLLALKELVEQ
jgi:hypothetical protein